MGRKRNAQSAEAIKDLVRDRDRKCTVCGIGQKRYRRISGRQLDVHRVVPGSEYTMEGCVSVCKGCHNRIHEKIGRPYRGITNGNMQAKLTPELVRKVKIYCALHGLKRHQFVAKVIEDAIGDVYGDLVNRHGPKGSEVEV